MDIVKTKKSIIEAGEVAIEQLIEVAKEKIIRDEDFDEDGNPKTQLAADRLKNAAATKKLAIFDAFEILAKIESERSVLENEEGPGGKTKPASKGGFAEQRARSV